MGRPGVRDIAVRLLEHLQGRHNQKSHGNRRNKKGGGGGARGSDAPPKKDLSKIFDAAPKDKADFNDHLMQKVESGEISFADAQQLNAKFKSQKTYQSYTDFKQADREWNSWAKGLSKNERSALENYQSEPFHRKPTDYIKINRHLRDGDDPTPATRAAVKGLDNAINKGSVPQNTLVYRGLPANLIGKEGSVFQDNGFVSTSLNSKVAGNFATSKNVIAEIRVPKGSKGAYMDSLKTDLSKQQPEHELILPRGSRFKIVSSTGSKVIMELLNG